jgi:hypothetical protein
MEPGFQETADVQPYTTRRARLLDDLTLSCRLSVKKEQRFPRRFLTKSRSRSTTRGFRPVREITSLHPPNDTLAKLQAAPHSSSDAARPLPRLKMNSVGATCNGRDAVANESTEALQRRANISAVCQLQLVVRRRCVKSRLQP